MGRKDTEKTSNLDIYYENRFKDLCFRSASKSVLSQLIAKRKCVL